MLKASQFYMDFAAAINSCFPDSINRGIHHLLISVVVRKRFKLSNNKHSMLLLAFCFVYFTKLVLQTLTYWKELLRLLKEFQILQYRSLSNMVHQATTINLFLYVKKSPPKMWVEHNFASLSCTTLVISSYYTFFLSLFFFFFWVFVLEMDYC